MAEGVQSFLVFVSCFVAWMTSVNGIEVFFSQSVYYVNESDFIGLVTVETSELAPMELSVTVGILMGTASFGEDYYSLSQDITFEPGERLKTIGIEILNDDSLEAREDILLFLFVFDTSTSALLPGNRTRAVLVILDDEFLGVSFNVSEVTVEEGSIVEVQLLLEHPLDVDFVVDLISRAVNGFVEVDFFFEDNEPSASFLAGEVESFTVHLTTVDDNVWEGLKTLDIGMDFPSDQDLNFTVWAVEPKTMRVNILDDDAVNISFQAASMSVREDVGVLSLQLVSSGAAYTSPFSVSVVCSGGTSDADYVNRTYSTDFVDFYIEDTLSSPVEIEIVDDEVTVAREPLVCSLLPPSGPSSAGLVVVDPDVISITIEDNDVAILFSSSEVFVREGEAVGIQLVMFGDFYQNFTVNLMFVNGTAVHPEDFNYEEYASVTFSPGSALSTVYQLSTVKNSVWKGTVSFYVTLDFPENPGTGINLLANGIGFATVHILEMDVVDVWFQAAFLSVGEDVGELSLQLVSGGAYTVPFALDVICSEVVPAEAEAGEDFVATPYSVMFSDFNSQQSLSTLADVVIINDTMAEFTESFKCVISAPDGEDARGIVIADPNTVTIAIQDNDELLVRLRNVTPSVVKEDGGSVQVYFEAIREVSSGIYVPAEYSFDFQILVRTVDGSAKAGSDFGGKQEVLNISAGEEISTPFIVTITDDTVSECTERFNISYSVVSSSVTGGASVRQLDSKATVVIEDNDEARISFERCVQAVTEVDGVLELRLQANRVFAAEQFFDLAAEDGTATCGSNIGVGSGGGSGGGSGIIVDFDTDFDGADYVLLVERVRFPPNSTLSDPLYLQIVDDDEIEGYEVFYLSLSISEASRSCGVVYGEHRTMDVSIRDDDGVRVGLIPDAKSVVGVEGQTVSLKVYRDGCTEKRIRMNVRITSVTASDVDYFLVTKSVTFKASTLSVEIQHIKVVLKADGIDEGIESFNVVLSSVHGKDVGFDIQYLPVFILPFPFDPHILPMPAWLPQLPLLPASVPPSPTSCPGVGSLVRLSARSRTQTRHSRDDSRQNVPPSSRIYPGNTS